MSKNVMTLKITTEDVEDGVKWTIENESGYIEEDVADTLDEARLGIHQEIASFL